MPKKNEKLSEKQIDDLFIVTTGFNLPPETPGKTRFDGGTDKKPHFVTEKDFSPEHWKELRKQGAIQIFEKPETEAEKEKIVLEVIED